MSSKRDYAKQLAVHYFVLIGGLSDKKWHSDCIAEINILVDTIIDAAKEELKEELKRGL